MALYRVVVNARNSFPVGWLRKTYVMASESVRWQWIRPRLYGIFCPRATLDFRSRISGLEANPFTVYWARPCGLWPNEFPPSLPPSYNNAGRVAQGTRKRCLFLIIWWNIGPESRWKLVTARYVWSPTKLRVVHAFINTFPRLFNACCVTKWRWKEKKRRRGRVETRGFL